MAKDYGIGQQIEEQAIDVYVPEYDVTVKASPAASANVVNNLARMKVGGGKKGFNTVGGLEGTCVGDAYMSYIKRVSEERSGLDNSYVAGLKGYYEGLGKGFLRYIPDVTAHFHDLYQNSRIYFSEKNYIDELDTKRQNLATYVQQLEKLQNPSEQIKYQVYGGIDTSKYEEQKKESIKEYNEKIKALQEEIKNLESDEYRKALFESQKQRKKAADAYWDKIDEMVGMPKSDIAAGMESVVTSLFLAPTGPVGLGTAYGVSGAGELLLEMKEKGVDERTAYRLATFGGVMKGIANTIGDRFILTKAIENVSVKSGIWSVLKGALTGGTGEFAEEGSESLSDDFVRIIAGINDKSALQVVADAFVSGMLGFASGAVFGAGSAGVELNWKTQEKAKNVERFKKAGLSQETSEKIAQAFFDAQDPSAIKQEVVELINEDIDPSKYKDADMQKDIDETVSLIPDMMNRFLTQNEIEIPKAEPQLDEEGKAKPMPEEKPVYTISGVDVSKETMPQLHNLLYQAEASGTPITNIAEALQKIDEVSGMSAKRKLRSQFEKVQEAVGKRLQARFGEAYGRSIGQLAAANIYAGAKLNGMSFEQYYHAMFPKINMNLKAVEELTETDNIPFQSERINTRWGRRSKEEEEVAQKMNEIDAEEAAKGVPEYTAPTININGVERQTTNSNGDHIAKSEKSLRYFYNWFGDSKVVDKDGRPLVVYHGTRSDDFSVFDRKYAERGFFFATEQRKKSLAGWYARDGGRIMPVYLSLQNPFIGTPTEYAKAEDSGELSKYDGVISIADDSMTSRYYDKASNEIKKETINKGDIVEVVAFEPNQIKSIDNRGTFSSADERFLYQQEQVKPIVEFNAVTFEDPENKESVKKAFLKNGFTEKAADDAIDNLQRVVDFAKQLGEESERLREQNERRSYIEQRPTEDVAKYEPEEMSLAVQGDKKTLGLVPRVSIFVKNGEYQYNIDFGTTCTRREPLEAAVRIMIDLGKAKNLGLTQINNIKDILGKHGFTKPCVLCFVEGKRTYELISANRLSRQWNVVLNSLGIDDGKVIGTERTMSEELLNRLKEMESGKGYEKYVDKQYRDKDDKDPVGLTKARAKAIAKIMLSEFERTGKSTLTNRMRPDMLMNSRGTDYLFRKYVKDAPTLKGLIAARDGAGTPKPHTSYPVYDTKSWKEIFDMKKNVKAEVKHLFDIGGVRLQSFSDFNEYMVIDYLQAMLDLSARGLPAHAYTKVTSFVELFGEMLNINMSLIGNSSRDIPVEYDGLKPAGKGDRVVFEDENGKWTYNWATESFDPQKAFELRKEDRFKGKVGTVGIGISDNQILAMLNDPEIDMIIPFHKSGIQDHVLISAGLKRADGTSVKDYSDYQNTKGKPKKANDYLFNEHMQELKDAKKVAKDYLRWCKEKGYTPKFEQFSKHENYYKLLEDFRTYDNNGKPVVQKAVEFKLGKDFNNTLKEAIRNRDEVVGAISKIKENKALMEDLEEAVKFAHLDGELKKATLGKIEKAIGGKDNLKVLSQEDMFDELAKTDPDKAQMYRDGSGVLYGFAKEGKIYLNVQGFNAHTPVHEYAHLWARVVQNTNKALWDRGVSLLKQTEKWKELEKDEQYKEILKNEDMFASEVFARIVGEYNEDIAKFFQDPDRPEYKNDSLKNKILQFIRDVFGYIRSMFDKNFNPKDVKSAKDFATMSLLDLYDDARATELAKRMRDMRKKGEFSISRDMLNNPMFQSGFVSMRNALVGTQLDADAHYGEGERGNMAHGWGNYLLLDQYENKANYYNRFNKVTVEIKDKRINKEIPSDFISGFEGMLEAGFYNIANTSGTKEERINAAKEWVIRNRENYINELKEERKEKQSALDKKGFIKNKEIRADLEDEVAHLGGLINTKETELRFFKMLNPEAIKIEGGTAEQHEFEIPEKDLLLDEKASLEDQPTFVKEALEKLNKKEGKTKGFLNALRNYNPDSKIDGYMIYHKLAQWSPESDFAKENRWASKELESVGIKGIYYEGARDGAGVVIFNKEDTKHIRRLLQENGQVVRGAYDQDTNMMYLFEDANRSTFLHEMAHAWMNIVINGKTEQAKAIKKAIDEFVGNKGEPYTREQLEKFAKGFEQYCSEGVAPNNFLKNAFRNFKNWLISLWKVANGTGVELNDDIRQVYRDMLGGNDVDALFSDESDFKDIEDMVAKIENIEAKRQEERAKKVEQVAEAVADAVEESNSVKRYAGHMLDQKKKEARAFGKAFDYALKPISTRAKEIDPAFALRIRKYMLDEYNFVNEYAEMVKPLFDSYNEMDTKDRARFDIYMKNAYQVGIDNIVKKYGIEDEYKAFRDAMEGIYQKAIDVGLKMNHRDVYAPRRIKDKQEFLEYMNSAYASLMSQMTEELGDGATIDQKAEWLDQHLRTAFKSDPMKSIPANAKERTIDIITPELNKHYYNTMDAIAMYIENMAQAINLRKMWGATKETEGTNEGLDKSIGEVIAHLKEEGRIETIEEENEVRAILDALLGNHGNTNAIISAIKSGAYINMLTRGSQTISQLADIGTSAYRNGLIRTLQAMFGRDIDIEDVGVEKLTEELRTKEGVQKWLESLLKVTGFSALDVWGKNTYLNARYHKLQEMARKNPEKLKNELEWAWEDETDALVNDLANDEWTERVQLLMFSELSDVQPTTKAEMPAGYLNNPNGRVLYMLKTFAIRRMDMILNDTIRLWKEGDKKQAMSNLVFISLLMGGAEALVSILRDFIKGKPLDVSDAVIEAALGLVMMNRYQVYKASEEGWSGLAATFLPPMFPMESAFIEDMFNMVQKDMNPKDMRTWSYIPLIGDAYYWWIGGGYEKNKKKRLKK